MARRGLQQNYHGLLIVDKPYGMVSKDVSRWLEKRIGREKIGHMGTLDPLASGILPILLGRATRLQDFLLEMDKGYEFEITFGTATETMDKAGEIVEELPYDQVSESRLLEICTDLEGPFLQIPPIYSALKFRGKPLYEYAREGRKDEVPLNEFKKHVEIKSLKLLMFEGNVAKFEIVCSKGTYVRVVAETIARRCGTCGYVTELVRTKAAGFTQDQAMSLESIESRIADFKDLLIPMNHIDLNLPKWVISDGETTRRLKLGQKMLVDMRYFEDSLSYRGTKRLSLKTIDNILLLDNEQKSFGIGSAISQDMGRLAIQMRRGLS